MTLRHAIALACVLTLSGCTTWAMQRQKIADDIAGDGSFKLCCLDHQIDPLLVSECIRTNPDVNDVRQAWLCIPAEKREDYQRCVSIEQARFQSQTHVVNCQNNILTGTTCISQ